MQSVNPFVDVDYADYFYLPVQWMVTEGVTKGVAPAVFGPAQTNNRAQLATFLWRFAGEPIRRLHRDSPTCRPVASTTTPVAWMKETGITTGTSATLFSPDGTVTRAQAAAFLWRFAGEPASDEAIAFTDVPGRHVLQRGRPLDGRVRDHHGHRRRPRSHPTRC